MKALLLNQSYILPQPLNDARFFHGAVHSRAEGVDDRRSPSTESPSPSYMTNTRLQESCIPAMSPAFPILRIGRSLTALERSASTSAPAFFVILQSHFSVISERTNPGQTRSREYCTGRNPGPPLGEGDRALLEEVYAQWCDNESRAAREAMLIMDPPPDSIIWRIASLIIRKGPVTLTSKDLFVVKVYLGNGPGRLTPAQLTRISRRPLSPRTVSTMRFTSSIFETSPWHLTAFRPAMTSIHFQGRCHKDLQCKLLLRRRRNVRRWRRLCPFLLLLSALFCLSETLFLSPFTEG